MNTWWKISRIKPVSGATGIEGPPLPPPTRYFLTALSPNAAEYLAHEWLPDTEEWVTYNDSELMIAQDGEVWILDINSTPAVLMFDSTGMHAAKISTKTQPIGLVARFSILSGSSTPITLALVDEAGRMYAPSFSTKLAFVSGFKFTSLGNQVGEIGPRGVIATEFHAP